MPLFRKSRVVWLASSYCVEAGTTDEAIERATLYLRNGISEPSDESTVSFTGDVLPMDTTVSLALQLLILENKGGAVAKRVAALKAEIVALLRQA